MGAVLREQNALPHKDYISIHLTAKDAIDNGGAGRAAKGANPSFKGTFFVGAGRELEESPNCRGFARRAKKAFFHK